MPVSRRQSGPAEPPCLRPYTFHGVDFAAAPGGSHAVADCPFCGREGKFSVEVATGLWRCLVCGTGTDRGGGNALVFVRLLYERAAYSSSTPARQVGPNRPANGRLRGAALPAYPSAPDAAGRDVGVPVAFPAAVAADRRLLDSATVEAWGVRKATDGTWLVPGYGADEKLDQVYRRTKILDKGEWVWRLLPTPGLWPEGKVHALHMPVGDFDPERPNLVVCEGPWDGMALWEVSPRDGTTNIIAVPGCNVWRNEWTQLCKGKTVTLMFDSDHPREAVPGSGRMSRAGYDGMVRIVKKLSGVAASVRWLRWGEDGYDPTKPSGWDVRDELGGGSVSLSDRRVMLEQLLLKIEDAPREWFNPTAPLVNGQPQHTKSVEALPCSTFAACEQAWKDATRWRQELSDALATLLAVCASTQQSGNQLFLDLIGNPGSLKTTMCRGLLVSGNCIHLENVTKLVSGYKIPGDAGKDCSFISRANGKTWVTCEFDTLGSSPEYHQLMGKVRRIFDGETSTTYGNSDEDRIYTALRTPWIRAGTKRMMDHDQSQLGDRFLRFIIEDPDNTERREIVRSALRSERAAMVESVNATAGSMVDPKTRLAHALTGGYVDWLRANVEQYIGGIDISTSVEDYCIDLAELSADLRARPTDERRKVESYDVKELPTRLARQNIRLASCLAVVHNKREVDNRVLGIIRKVALDTAAGHSLNIAKWLCSPNPKAEYQLYQESGGLGLKSLEGWTGMASDRLGKYLSFLRNIDVIEWREIRQSLGGWFLTERVYDLYLRVMGRAM